VRNHDVVVEEGGFLFKRGIVHALWNPTDVEAVVIEFISPAGFEGFFQEMGALQGDASPRKVGRDRRPLRADPSP
jgi:hypothetical protein